MHPSPANHPCLVCGRATSQCQTACTANTDDIPAEDSTPREQLRPPRDSLVEPSLTAELNEDNGTTSGDTTGGTPIASTMNGDNRTTSGDTAGGTPNTAGINGDNRTTSGDTAGGTPNTAGINGDNGTTGGDTGRGSGTSNTVIINGRGQGGNGGDASGTGGAGGAGEGNQVQIHHTGGEITVNIYGRDRDIDFVLDMAMCLAWLGLSTLALARLHLALVG
ncbi:hypothetical protein C8R44DRAFT_856841 [Mycena epipterygia]|nr:hypothetical protein C8R44DRAFT_856841 [Mycena epipterygia]